MGWLRLSSQDDDPFDPTDAEGWDDRSETQASEDCVRPGRFRRYVLRPVFWSLALAALVVFLLQLWIDSPPARERARAYVVDTLSRSLSRDVSLSSIRFRLLPFHVELRDFRIDGGPGSDAPFLDVPYVYAEADLDALRRRRIHLQLLRLERPEINLRFYPGGGDNLVPDRDSAPRGPDEASEDPFELRIDQVEIERADLDLEQQQAEISVDAYRVRTRLRGLGDFRLAGRLSAAEVVVRLPESDRLRVAVVVDGILEKNRLQVDHGRILGDTLQLQVSGECEWDRAEWQHRNCTFQAAGHAEGRALDQLGYFRSLDGRLELDGVFAWRPGAVGWRGGLRSDAFRLWGRRFTDFDGHISADRFRVDLAVAHAGYSDGHVSGAVVADLTDPEIPITADLDLEDLHLDTLLTDQGLPVRGLAARVDGHLFYTCPVRDGLKGSGDAEVELRPDPSDPGLPIQGRFPLRLDDGWVFADAAGIISGSQSLLAVGAYHLDWQRGRFDYEVATADVSELVPLLPVGDDPPDYLPTAGTGRLSGSLQVQAGFTYNTLTVDLEGVQTPRIPVARVTGSLDVTPWALENLHLDLRHDLQAPERRMVIRGRVPWSPEAGFTRLTFDAESWPLDKAKPWIPFELPLRGDISGRLDLSFDHDSVDGDLSASMGETEVLGIVRPAGVEEPFLLDGILADLSWDGEAIRFDQVTAYAPAGETRGRGSIHWQDGAMDLRLRSDALDVGQAPLGVYLPRSDLRTSMVIDAHLAGTLNNPRVNVTADAERLIVGGRELTSRGAGGRPCRFDAFWSDGRLEIAGNLLNGAELTGGGLLDLPNVDLELAVTAADLAAVTDVLLPGDLTVGGTLEGRLSVAGDVSRGALSPVLELDELDLTIEGRHLVAEPPVRAEFAFDHWSLERLRLAEPRTASFVHLAGRLGYHAGTPIDLTGRADLEGSWLRLALPDLQLDGRLKVDGRIAGSPASPELYGDGTLEDGSLPIYGLEKGFEAMTGHVQFAGDRLTVDALQGRLSGGRVEATGELAWPDDGPLTYRFDLDGHDVVVPELQGWLLEGDTTLTLRSTLDGHLLSGSAALDRLDYREDIRFDMAQILRDLLSGRQAEVGDADSLLAAVQLLVRIEANDSVTLRNNVAQLTGSADLQLRGNLAQPILFGELVMDPGGQVIYNSTDYRLERGRLVFADPYRLDPEVDLLATTKVRDFDINLALSGPLEKLEAQFSSEPPLPDVEVFRLLAGGETYVDQAELVPDRTAKLNEDRGNSAAGFLYGQAASAIGDRVSSLFGFDKFRIDPLTGSGDNLAKAQLTVGKRLSKDLFLTYSVDPSTPDNQKIRVEWQLTDSLVLVLTQNGDDTFSADARWESTF